jgi:hypothetical protein
MILLFLIKKTCYRFAAEEQNKVVTCRLIFELRYSVLVPIPVAARSKVKVCGRLVAGITGSNSARGIAVCLLCLYVVLSCVARGLCNGLITRPEESYHVSNCMCDHRNLERGPMLQMGTTGK